MGKSDLPGAGRQAVAILAVVVIVHLGLAFTSTLPSVHTGGDNAAYISLAHSLARDGTFSEVWHPGAPPHSRYPPLYPAVLALLILLGAKTWGVFKAVSLLFTGLSTAFCFLWVRKLHGARSAVVLALLFGVAPAVLISAQWILSDPLFLALTLGCLWLLTPKPRASGEPAGAKDLPRLPSNMEIAAGLVLAAGAYFTRLAGLPLIAAVALWLVLRRRWRSTAVLAGVFAVPALLWRLRSGGDYVSVFWMINPYAPDLGRAGPRELVQRVGENLWSYMGGHIPTGLTGLEGFWAAALGVVLVGLAVVGWFRRVRTGPGVAEIFCLLYTGLILAWPAVWSGDRFALPLLPLILLYAGQSSASLAGRLSGAARSSSGLAARPWPWLARAVAVAVAAVFLVPAGISWSERAGTAAECGSRVAMAGPMGCYGMSVREFHSMARWAGEQLPEGAVVFSRKPRLFHAFSGRPSVTYPFTTDGRSLLVQADSLGVGYLVRSNWGTAGPLYVDPVIAANPDRFCVLAQMQAGQAPPISLLAITEPRADDARVPADPLAGLGSCPGERWTVAPSAAAIASMTVPILDR